MATDRTDEEVIRASFTEPELFALIFDRHVRRVHAFLGRRVGIDGADSLTGETFRIAFERRTTYLVDRPDSLPWLYGIAHNLLRHHWRGLDREDRSLRRLGSVEQSDSRDDVLLDRVAAQAMWPRVQEALETMRHEDRDVILLVAWEELSYAEVALALDVPIGTVRSRLHRARRHLRDLISTIGQEGDDDNRMTSDGRYVG